MFRGDAMNPLSRLRERVALSAAKGRVRGLPLIRASLLILFLLLFLVACQRNGPTFQKMGAQPKYDPLEPSDFFVDGMSARPRIAGTVARGEVGLDPYFETGKINGQDGDGFPFPITAADMARGHERFDIYCSECHGRLGDGNGMIPSRGFRRPPSFHTPTLRAAKTAHFFDVMTNGFGAMPPYRTMIPTRDRWTIVAYIRALQLSQGATVNDVPAEDRSKLSVAAPASGAGSTGEAPAATHGGVQ